MTYACTTFTPVSGSSKLKPSDKYSKITLDYIKCRLYFNARSLKLFLSKDH